MENPVPKRSVFSIGHSTRAAEEFFSLLGEFGIEAILDVRRYPSSRKFPHFNQGNLSQLLQKNEIAYFWLEKLGGRRHAPPDPDSPNTGILSPAFRSYADYMLTEEFKGAVRKIFESAKRYRCAIMCAEKLFWKCHRRFLCDYLLSQGLTVFHILESGNLRPHQLTRGAVVTPDRTVLYPSPPTLSL
jgi:uncharacterized protein (DUF488 family)